MNHKRKTPIVLTILILVLSVTAISALAQLTFIVVDSFSDAQCTAGLPALCETGEPLVNTIQGSGILGGERDVQLTLLNNPLAAVRISGDGRLHYANGPGTQSIALLAWDGPATVNITAKGTETVSVEIADSEAAGEVLDSLEGGAINSIPYDLEGSVQTVDDKTLGFEAVGYIYPLPGRPGYFR